MNISLEGIVRILTTTTVLRGEVGELSVLRLGRRGVSHIPYKL